MQIRATSRVISETIIFFVQQENGYHNHQISFPLTPFYFVASEVYFCIRLYVCTLFSVLMELLIFQDKDEVTKLRVENSWGEEYGEKGCVTMTADFFKEFTLEIVVDKKFVPSEVLEVFEQEPEVIPMWYLL